MTPSDARVAQRTAHAAVEVWERAVSQRSPGNEPSACGIVRARMTPSSIRLPSPANSGTTLADVAAETLRRQIVEGVYPVGSRLPPERLLIDQLCVSRTVLREALSRLEALGLVQARSTRGRFVTGGVAGRSSSIVSAWLHQHGQEILEVDEVRSLVEGHVVQSMGADQARDAALFAEAILDRQERAINGEDAVAAAEADEAFHRLLCSYTTNQVMRVLAGGLIEQNRKGALAVYSLGDAARQSLAQHRAIVTALALGDVVAAASLAREHMNVSARRHVEAMDAES